MITLEERQAALRVYSEHALGTMPLRPNKKSAFVKGWPEKAPDELWRVAPDDANIGIRCGGLRSVAVIDCDDDVRPGTFAKVQQFLAGLGLKYGDYPVVQTASGVGRHVFISLLDPPPGNSKKLPSALGAGEFRYGPRAYVVAEPSVVEASKYRRLTGDLRRMPTLTENDIRILLPTQPSAQPNPPERPNGEIGIPRRTLCLLEGNTDRPYKSRSERAQAILVGLVNAGFTFDEALDLFLQYPAAGKFRELYDDDPANAKRWLCLSWDSAFQWATTHEGDGRQRARRAIDWANNRPEGWPGRTGPSDRAVYVAHATIAYRSGAIQYAASERTLGEMAGVHRHTARAATERLLSQGDILLEAKANGKNAAMYRLAAKPRTCTTSSLAANCGEVVQISCTYGHDAFRHGALNNSGAEVWLALQSGPLTEAELAKLTGRHVETVRRALDRMTGLEDLVSGEVVDMVHQDGDRWYASQDVDLDQVARIMGSAGEGERQRRNHEHDRDAYYDYLERRDRQSNRGN